MIFASITLDVIESDSPSIQDWINNIEAIHSCN